MCMATQKLMKCFDLVKRDYGDHLKNLVVFVLPLLLFCCYRAAALRHDTLMNRSLPCHTPTGQQSYSVSTSRPQESQTKRREKVREWNQIKSNEIKLNKMDLTALEYLEYPSVCMFPFCRKTWPTNNAIHCQSVMMASLFVDEDKL